MSPLFAVGGYSERDPKFVTGGKIEETSEVFFTTSGSQYNASRCSEN